MSYCDNPFQCIQVVLVNILNLYIFYQFCVGCRYILTDQNKVLDRIDKLVYMISFTQILELLIIFFCNKSILLWSFNRVLMIGSNLTILFVFLCILLGYNDIISPYYQLFIRIVSFFTVCWWISINFITNVDKNICYQLQWAIFSGISFFIIILEGIVGILITMIIFRFFRENKDQPIQGQNKIAHDEAYNRLISVVSLMGANILSCLFIFVNEFKNYENPVYVRFLSPCSNIITQDISFQQSLFEIIQVFIEYLLPPLSVYYVFYWRNKNVLQIAIQTHEQFLKIVQDQKSFMIKINQQD